MIKKLFIFLIFVLFFLVSSASAETGSIVVTDTQSLTYTNGGIDNSGATVWNYLIFDSRDWDKINDIKITNSTIVTLALVNDFESTRFTCTTNCLGGGWFYYQKNPNTVKYVFDSDTTFTSSSGVSEILVTFNSNKVRDNATVFSPMLLNTGPTTANSLRPVCVKVDNPTDCTNLTYESSVSVSTTNYYNVTYGGANLFSVNISKLNIPTKWILLDVDYNQYPSETTFNTVNKTLTNDSYNGIRANVSISSGAFTFTTINLTGTTGAPTIVNPGTGGSESGQISYNYTTASVGQKYGFNANISSSNFSSFNTYYIYAYDSTNSLITGFPLDFNSQTYSSGRFWTFNKAGTYKANISYCGNVLGVPDVFCTSGITSKTFLDTASISIPVPTYNYSVTTDALNYQQGNTIQIIASNPSTSDAWLTAFGETGIITDIAWNTLIPAGETIAITKTIPQNMPKGTYTLNLATTEGYAPIVAQAVFNITSATTGTNVLSVLWDESLYLLGRTATITSTSNYNSSTLTITSPGGLTQSYIFPSNSTNYTLVDLNEVGLWKARIEDNNNASRYAQSNTTVTSGNPTDNETFTSCKSAENYVCWDKKQYEQGEAYTIAFRLSIVAFNTYFPYIQTINPSNQIIDNRSVNTSYDPIAHIYSGSISGSFTPQATVGVYFARMWASDLSGVATVRAESATEVIGKTTAPTPTTDIETGTNDLLAGNFITIILVMIAFAGIGLELGGFMGSLLGFSSGFIVLGVLGIMPIWAIFLFAIIAITAFAVVAGKQFTGGGND